MPGLITLVIVRLQLKIKHILLKKVVFLQFNRSVAKTDYIFTLTSSTFTFIYIYVYKSIGIIEQLNAITYHPTQRCCISQLKKNRIDPQI